MGILLSIWQLRSKTRSRPIQALGSPWKSVEMEFTPMSDTSVTGLLYALGKWLKGMSHDQIEDLRPASSLRRAGKAGMPV